MKDGTTELTTLKFQTAKQQHSKMIYVQATFQNRILAALYYTSEENNNAYRFLFGWDNPTDRLVDFGTEPQPVSETFYRFLTENAVPATREDYMDVVTDYVESVEKVTISGYWKWNEVIYPEAMTNNAMYIRIKGTLANRKVAYMYYFSNGVNNGELELNFAAKEDSIPNFCAWGSTRSTPWDDDKERYIYLGDEEQTITQSEYQFFVANATPCTKEEYDSMVAKDGRETTWGSTEYTGKHLWTEYVPWEDKSNAGNDWGEDTIPFTSNGKEYTILRGQYDPETKVHTIFYGTADEMTAVYSTQTGWVDEVYRTIIFKEGTIVHIETLNQVQNYCKPVSQ